MASLPTNMEHDMRRSVLTAALLLAILPVAIAAGCFELGRGEDTPRRAEPEPDPAAQQRFIVKFCYAQYRGQSDILRCLKQASI
jgi:hypothetical protein